MRIRKINVDEDKNIRFLASVSDALSHPVRIALLCYVRAKRSVDNTICNKDLVELFDYSQSTISQHVKKLVDSGLLHVQKVDKNSVYSVSEEIINRYLSALKEL